MPKAAHSTQGARWRRALVWCALPLILPATLLAQAPPPNDPLVPQQWGLERVGAPCAWGRTTGSPEVTVAVVDSGVDLAHPDLAASLRADGYDFVDDDAAPWDANGHGTHVAGVIGAALDNGAGGAGLAPGARILPVRVVNAEGTGSDRAIAAGIRYAAEQGAQVINLSLGATLLFATPEGSPQVIAAIGEALDAGAVVVAAAGNDILPLPNAIVGKNEAVIVVAASDRDERKAGFSNSGPWVDLVAPGERIVSTMPTYEVFLTSAALPPEERFAPGYDSMSGTSQAAALVSAVAALLLSEHPDWTAAQVREAIVGSTAAIYAGHPSYYRRLRLLGSGRLDACAALAWVPGGQQPLEAFGVARPTPPLAVGAIVAGVALLVGAVAGAFALARRPTRATRTSGAARPPVLAPPAPAPAATPPVAVASASGPLIDATLAARRVAWGVLRVVSGPDAPAAFALSEPDEEIGRDDRCTVDLAADRAVSRRHARLSLRDGLVTVTDLGSSHGTRVGGHRIGGPAVIRPDDLIAVGQTVLRYELPGTAGHEEP